MMLRPAVLALLMTAVVSAGLLMAVAPWAVEIAWRWDRASLGRAQLRRERRLELMALMVGFAAMAQMAALLLFVWNADRMAPLFTGAMCAVGVLKAGEGGFAVLGWMIGMFFASAVWLAVDAADRATPEYRYARLKAACGVGLGLGAAGLVWMEWRYFAGLRTDVVTSCCARLYGSEGEGVAAGLAGVAPRAALAWMAGALVVAVGACLWGRRAWMAAASAAAFAATIVGVISVVGPFVYEQPNHHCPFCLLKGAYAFQGYLLYGPLFAATACGLGAAATGGRRQARAAAVLFALTGAVAALVIVKSNLNWRGMP